MAASMWPSGSAPYSSRPGPPVYAPAYNVSSPPLPPRTTPTQLICKWFDTLSSRDTSLLGAFLTADCAYDNPALGEECTGRAAVCRLYLNYFAVLPEDALFVVEKVVEDADGPGTVAASWHLELKGARLPLSRGVGLYRLAPDGRRLCALRESPEVASRDGLAALGALVSQPLIRSLVLPAVSEAANKLLTPENTSVLSALSGGGTILAVGSLPLEQAVQYLKGTAGPPAMLFTRQQQQQALTQSPQQAHYPPQVSSNIVGMWPQQPAAGAQQQHSYHPQDFSQQQPFHSLQQQQMYGQAGQPQQGQGQGQQLPFGLQLPDFSSLLATLGYSAPQGPDAYGGASTSSASSYDSLMSGGGSASGSANPSAASGRLPQAGVARQPLPGPPRSTHDPVPMRPLGSPTTATTATSSYSYSNSSASAGAMSQQVRSAAGVEGQWGVRNGAIVQPNNRVVGAPPSPAAPAGASAPWPNTPAPSSSSSTMSSSGPSAARAAPDSSQSAWQQSSSSSRIAVRASASASANTSTPGSTSMSSTAMGGGGGNSSAGGGSGGPPGVSFSTVLGADLSGLWEKDPVLSQVAEYEAMLDVLQLSGLQKVTARLIEGVDIKQTTDRFEVNFVTVVPFFRVTESNAFDAPSTYMRRDLRPGQQTARTSRVPGGVLVDMTWGQPLAGRLTEEYSVSTDGAWMRVASFIEMGGKQARVVAMYRRVDASVSKAELLARRRTELGSMDKVLREQAERFGS